MMADTQNKEKTYITYAVWNNVPFIILSCSFLLALQVFLIIQILQSSPGFSIEVMSFFIVLQDGDHTSHKDNLVA